MNSKRSQARSGSSRPRPVPKRTTQPKGRPSSSSSSRPTNVASIAFSRRTVSTVPQVSGSYGRTVIRHRELVATVSTAMTWTAVSYAINPGMSATFPWLSTQAPSWEMYQFRRLKFEYIARCATNTVGVVVLACDYDAADAAPQSEQIACSYQGAESNSVWVPGFDAPLLPSRLHPNGPKFVRLDALGANQDIKTYDGGNFFVCTTDAASVNTVGKLWVEYEIEFFVPSLPPTGSLVQGSLHSTAGGTISRTNIFGSAPVTITNGNMNVVLSTVANTITFNTVGQFLVQFYQTGTVMFGGGAVTFTGTATLTASDLQMAPTAATTSIVTARVTVTAAGQTLIPVCTVHTTVTANVLIITDYPALNGSVIV